MTTDEAAGPVPAPEAFEDQSAAGQLSQAALLLSVGAAAAGHADIVPVDQPLEFPALRPLRATTPMDVGEATRYVDLSVADHLARPDLRIEPEAVAPLARRLVDRPEPGLAASMIEASQHSPHRVVRTAATVAALDTTGPREDLLARLADDARARAGGSTTTSPASTTPAVSTLRCSRTTRRFSGPATTPRQPAPRPPTNWPAGWSTNSWTSPTCSATATAPRSRTWPPGRARASPASCS